MNWLSDVDWQGMFHSDIPVIEIVVRGVATYLALFILLRVILKRQAGTLGMTDLLVIVLIADAAQNGMSGDYHSLPDGLILVATLIFCNFCLEWLSFHVPWFEKLIQPPPLPLVKEGQLLRRNMRAELVTEDDLMSQLRQQGIEHLKDVKRMCMEGDGKISVVTYDKEPARSKRSDTAV